MSFGRGSFVPPEINAAKEGGFLIVGRDPDAQEVRALRPFVGAAGSVLERCLSRAGLRREDVNIANVVGYQPPANVFAAHSWDAIEEGQQQLLNLISRLKPAVIVGLGDEANWTLQPGGWDSSDGGVKGAKGIAERRGYFADTFIAGHRCVIMSAVHPASILHSGAVRGTNAAISEMLLTYDLTRAAEVWKEGFKRHTIDVKVISSEREAARVSAFLRKTSGSIACDVENFEDQRLACIGFAPSKEVSYVFTPAVLSFAFALVEELRGRLCFHNGQYDAYLMRRYGCTAEVTDDTMLLFHCCWPEIAGAAESGSKKSQKSLRFLGSLYSKQPFWKDYEFEHELQRYNLNGKDCCVTLEALEALREVQKELEIPEAIYRHEISLVPVVVDVLSRGITVAEEERQRRLQELSQRAALVNQKIGDVARRLFFERRERVEKQHLLWTQKTCGCCRNGSGKREACWSCAGFEKAPSKRELLEKFPNADPSLKKAELEQELLSACRECGGEGSWEVFEFNPNSSEQKVELLYNVLGLPKRYENGSLTTSEEKMKELLGTLS